PTELYEAARIDGAGPWARFRQITLPLLAPTSFFVLLTSMVAVVTGGLDMIFVLTSGGPANSTSLLIFYIYQQAFLFVDLGYAAAATLRLFVVLTSGRPAYSTSLLFFDSSLQAFLFVVLGYAAAVGSVLVAVLLLISAVMFLVTRGGRFSHGG